MRIEATAAAFIPELVVSSALGQIGGMRAGSEHRVREAWGCFAEFEGEPMRRKLSGGRRPQGKRYLLMLFWIPALALCQLNENCTVSILNRNARVDASGLWRIDNVPTLQGPVRASA